MSIVKDDCDYIEDVLIAGMFHEYGHNLQEWSWTFSDTLEVTVNIFSLFQMWRIFEVSRTTLTLTLPSPYVRMGGSLTVTVA